VNEPGGVADHSLSLTRRRGHRRAATFESRHDAIMGRGIEISKISITTQF
jgi:hypothetical protein